MAPNGLLSCLLLVLPLAWPAQAAPESVAETEIQYLLDQWGGTEGVSVEELDAASE